MIGSLIAIFPALILWYSEAPADTEERLLRLEGVETRTHSIRSDVSFHQTKRRYSGLAILKKRWRLASGRTRFVLQLQIENRLLPVLLDGGLRSWDEGFDLPSDTLVHIDAELLVITAHPWPWTFGAHLLRQGYVSNGELNSLQAVNKPASPRKSPRERLIERLVHRYGGRQSLAIVLASTLGEEGLLNPALKELFRSTSLTHQMVVSGFQVTLLWLVCEKMFGAFLGLLPLFRVLIFRERLLLLISGSLVFLYVQMLDDDVPSSRAWLALALVFLSRLLGRSLHSIRALIVVAYALLLVFPASCFDLSYQLTFAALMGLQLGSGWGEGKIWIQKAIFCHLGPLLCTSAVLLLWTRTVFPTALFFNIFFGWIFSSLFICGGGAFLLAEEFLPSWGDRLGGMYLDWGETYLDILGQTSRFFLSFGLGPWEFSAVSSWILGLSLFLWMFRELLQQNSPEYADETDFGCYGAHLPAVAAENP